jgi:TolB-like protein
VVLGCVAVMVGLNVGGWRDRILVRDQKPQVQALAVLPLANLSGDPEQEYFADGMTEALITELGRTSSPRVISRRQSVMQYKGCRRSPEN